MEFSMCLFAFCMTLILFLCSETAAYEGYQPRDRLQILEDRMYFMRKDITTLFGKTDQLKMSAVEVCGLCISGNKTSYPPVMNHAGRKDMVNVNKNNVLVKYRRLVKAFATEKKVNRDLRNRLRSVENIISVSKIVADERDRDLQNQLRSMNESIEDKISDIYRDLQHKATISDKTGYSWAEWKPWSNCSTYCDIGIKKRERLCNDHLGQTVDVSKCSGDHREKEWCHLEDCKDVDECLSNPCQRGTCVDKFKEFDCVCEMGWRGKNCEIRESCSSNPCIYGTCIDHDFGYNCTCEGAWGPRCEIPVYDCLDIREAGQRVNGVYSIRLRTTNETVDVLCEMESDGGGWTVFQSRFDGSVNFYQNFDSYKNGFGDKHGEHWLGLRHIYELTRSLTALRIELTAADGSTGYEEFASFRISAEPDYELDISDWSGSTGSKSTGIFYNNRNGFSTYDRDRSGMDCAEKDYGGWWFDNCAYANLNGYYGVPGSTGGYNGRQEAAITHRAFKSYQSLKATKMMLRRRSN